VGVAAVLALMVAACSSDGGGSPSPSDVTLARFAADSGAARQVAGFHDTDDELLAADPRLARLGRIVKAADTLVMSDVYFDYTFASSGDGTWRYRFTPTGCVGAACVVEDGGAVTVGDLMDLSADIRLDEEGRLDEYSSRIRLDGHGFGTYGGDDHGFNTIDVYSGGLEAEAAESLSASGPFPVSVDGDRYGVWGKHGFAAVETGRGFVLHSADFVQDATLVIDDTVGLTATIDILKAIAAGKGPRRSLLALGYAGWGPGQLDDEIQRNGWLCVPADDGLIFGGGLDDRWERAIGKLGIDASMLSGFAGRA